VVRANKTDQTALQSAVSQLRRVNVSILGIVLNGLSTRGAGYSYYPSYSASGEADGAPGRKQAGSRFLLRP
jgi:Mrp family chromosome partitioning ATPase